MGRTISPFRPALDFELQSWNEYRRGLRPENRIYFDRVARIARQSADAGSLAARPLLTEVIFFSVVIEQEKQIDALQTRLEALQTQVSQLERLLQQPNEEHMKQR